MQQRRRSTPSSVFHPGCSFIVILGDHFQRRRFAAAPDTRPINRSLCLRCNPKLCGGTRISCS